MTFDLPSMPSVSALEKLDDRALRRLRRRADRMMRRQGKIHLVAYPLVTVTCALLVAPELESTSLLWGWVLLSLVTASGRLLQLQGFERHYRHNPERWRLGFVIGTLLAASQWAWVQAWLADMQVLEWTAPWGSLASLGLIATTTLIYRHHLTLPLGVALALGVPQMLVLSTLSSAFGGLFLIGFGIFGGLIVGLGHQAHLEWWRAAANNQIMEQRLKAAEEARILADAANHAKSEFLANMSHEIRTPMNGVVGMTRLLLRTRMTDQQKDLVHTIQVSGESLVTILNDILDFSKIESGKLDIVVEPFDLEACVADALQLIQPLAKEKELSLSRHIDEATPRYLEGDATRIRQILVNLLSNAVKFTESGEVEVRVRSQNLGGRRHEVHVSVRDTGIGIDPKRVDGLFKPFRQADDSGRLNRIGTGLGLAISRRLSELMGGSIWTESTIGEGSTFHFTVVVKGAKQPLESKRPKASPVIKSPPVSVLAEPSDGLRILLAEDNPINQKVAEMMLEEIGYRADLVTNGNEVLEAVERKSYDVILMDVQMPGMDGLAATVELHRRYPDGGRPRIIGMTAHAMVGDRERCLQSGMDEYLTKPVRPEVLEAVLRGAEAVLERPTTSSQDLTQAIDDPKLEALRLRHQHGGLIPRLIRIYLNHIANDMRALGKSLGNMDRESLAIVAGRLKRRSSNLGASGATAICESLERLAPTAPGARLESLRRQLERDLLSVRRQLLEEQEAHESNTEVTAPPRPLPEDESSENVWPPED